MKRSRMKRSRMKRSRMKHVETFDFIVTDEYHR
jgi:hypothetical protein